MRVIYARDHEVLVVAHQHANVWQGAHDAQDANRVGGAVDHVAKAEEAIFLRGRDALEHPLKRRPVAVHVREDVCGHVADPQIKSTYRVCISLA